ncbi:MAG: four helix bundle protein [Verrucomicrobia bacterium]|jgi:four helix bundle protein|nr:four helix bundle protein [Verrucomicrobiota bacterium]
MNNENLKQRTRAFALEVIKVVEKLPRDMVSEVLGKQMLRSGTSVAANYRSATRAKSQADFIAKMGIVEEEADESVLWADLLAASARLRPDTAQPLMKEAGELTAIAVASIRTARRNATESRPTASSLDAPRSALRAPRST